ARLATIPGSLPIHSRTPGSVAAVSARRRGTGNGSMSELCRRPAEPSNLPRCHDGAGDPGGAAHCPCHGTRTSDEMRHAAGSPVPQLTTNQATLVLADTALFRWMVNELPVTLGTADRTQTPARSCCIVASTRLAEVSATPARVADDFPAGIMRTPLRLKTAGP